MGNSENHSTAKESKPNTSKLVFNLEANNTDAKIAALVDNEPGILIKGNKIEKCIIRYRMQSTLLYTVGLCFIIMKQHIS